MCDRSTFTTCTCWCAMARCSAVRPPTSEVASNSTQGSMNSLASLPSGEVGEGGRRFERVGGWEGGGVIVEGGWSGPRKELPLPVNKNTSVHVSQTTIHKHVYTCIMCIVHPESF